MASWLVDLMETWHDTLTRQLKSEGNIISLPPGMGPGGYPNDLSLAMILLPVYVAHLTAYFMGSFDPFSYVLPHVVQWSIVQAGLYVLIPVAFWANWFDLMGTTNGTGRGSSEQQASIRQWIDWFEINVRINFALADILYEVLFTHVFIWICWWGLGRGSSSAIIPLLLLVGIKIPQLMTWPSTYGYEIWSPLEFFDNLCHKWDVTQGGGMQDEKAYQ